MSTEGLLSCYDLTPKKVIIDSKHVFFTSDRDEFSVWCHVHIRGLFVRDAELFAHERYVGLITLWVDSEHFKFACGRQY